MLSLLLAVALGQRPVIHAPAPLHHPALTFRDGTTWRTATRVGLSTSGRALVELDSEGVAVRAEVGRGAIVVMRADLAAVTRVRLERALWPERSMWLVSSIDADEDGLALSSRLSRTDDVEWSAPDFFFEHRLHDFPVPPNDPRYSGQWYLSKLDVEAAWRITSGSPTVTIGVIDNGCDAAHPDLMANLRQGRDAVDGDDDPRPNGAGKAANHGTACAGLIAGVGNNGIGISGVCPNCTLRCIRMLADDGQMVPVSVDVDAFRAAFELDVDVVSNSWGFGQAIPVPAALALAIQEVATKNRGGRGALVLFAAGNDNRALVASELYSLPEVVTVGAVNAFDELAPFSNRGPALDLVAPTGTFTTDLSGAAGEDPGDYTSLFGGTSAACPVAAGVAGLLVSAQPDAGRAALEQWLIGTTRRAPFARADAGHDDEYGTGIVSASQALSRAMGLEPDAGPARSTPSVPDTVGIAAGVGCGCSAGGDATLLLAVLGLASRWRRTSRVAS